MPKKQKIEQIKLKVRRTQAKVSLIKGTGISILDSLKKLRTKIDEQSFKSRFIVCDDCHIDNFFGVDH